MYIELKTEFEDIRILNSTLRYETQNERIVCHIPHHLQMSLYQYICYMANQIRLSHVNGVDDNEVVTENNHSESEVEIL